MIPGWCSRKFSEGNPRSGSLQDLDATSGQIMDAARQRPELAATFTGFRPGVPQLDDAQVDRTKVKAFGVPRTQFHSRWL